jgi:hypothetical protein
MPVILFRFVCAECWVIFGFKEFMNSDAICKNIDDIRLMPIRCYMLCPSFFRRFCRLHILYLRFTIAGMQLALLRKISRHIKVPDLRELGDA